MQLHIWAVLVMTVSRGWLCAGNEDGRRLYDHLLMNYNNLIRPAENATQRVTVKFQLKMSQLIKLIEKSQIITTMVWLRQEWYDYNLRWSPADFGGIDHLHIPAGALWTPDIVLYNNADGNYEVSILNKAIVCHNGTVIWEPPALYNSMCPIKVRWFPFDEQECEMKFGSWTYDGDEVDLIHFDPSMEVDMSEGSRRIGRIEQGIDVSELTPSAEWDVMSVPSERHVEQYDCCPAPYIDITVQLQIRRKTLFYTVNLIIPSVAISFLTVMVFYLPSDSGEKVVLSISILISLTVFLLLLVEIIPSTSLETPLIGMYLLFTMIIVCCSIAVTVITLNVHYRSPSTDRLNGAIRHVFLDLLPKILCIQRPEEKDLPESVQKAKQCMLKYSSSDAFSALMQAQQKKKACERRPSFAFPETGSNDMVRPLLYKREENLSDNPVQAAVDGVEFIADHFRQQNGDNSIREDWQYIAQVLDRLFLWLFTFTCFVGTGYIFLFSPAFGDNRKPLVS